MDNITNFYQKGSRYALAQRARRERERCERQENSYNDKENARPMESKRALAQRARRDRERCERQQNSHRDVHLHQKEQETANAKDLAMASSHHDRENACPMAATSYAPIPTRAAMHPSGQPGTSYAPSMNWCSTTDSDQLARHKREQQKRPKTSHAEGHFRRTVKRVALYSPGWAFSVVIDGAQLCNRVVHEFRKLESDDGTSNAINNGDIT